jgi:excisionase family DNA binding protein
VSQNEQTDLKVETYTVPEAGQILGLCRNAAYSAARRGEIPTVKFGARLRVPKPALRRLLEA